MDQDNLNRIIEMAWEDRTPFDAIDTLNRCGLKNLYIGNLLISKKVDEKN